MPSARYLPISLTTLRGIASAREPCSASMTVLVGQVVNEVDALVRHIDNPHWTTKDASKKVRQSLRQLFRKYKLPMEGEPFESAWAYILKHY